MNGKRKRKDVRTFETSLADNIFDLHHSLRLHTYKHGPYLAFTIHDPKKRNIHKAKVRDRLLHHAIHRKLYPFYDNIFITDSYSCRNFKGMHKAIDRFQCFFRSVSKNNHRTVWVLKCDIRKFFDSVDHHTLLEILKKKIADSAIISLLENIIASFEKTNGKGIPLGNLTSQLFANVYMNCFDQWVKHHLKAKWYIRYADDFILMHHEKSVLEEYLNQIKFFLQDNLHLELHPHKVSITTLASGVDFLGWVHFPHHRVLRTVTKRRMLKSLKINQKKETVASYKGMLTWGNAHKISDMI